MNQEISIHLAEKRTKAPQGYLTKGSFHEVNDIYLSPFETFNFEKNKNGSALILPFIGDLKFKASNFEAVLEENKGLVLGNLLETDFQITNEYESDAVNFLHINLSENQGLIPFDSMLLNLAANTNVWHAIGSEVFIGQWVARTKGSYRNKANQNVLIYCLSGVFEVEDRLLEAKDSLEIMDSSSFTFEALAEESILLLINKSI